ncbi:MAG: hypothetical protein ACLP00_11790 [Terracidiphilus sp.]
MTRMRPIAEPEVLISGRRYVRRATGSTFNTVLMHVMNNVAFLILGLQLVGS